MICDGDWRLLNYDPATQKSTWVMFNDDGSTTVRTDMPVDAVIDENKAVASSDYGKSLGKNNRFMILKLK